MKELNLSMCDPKTLKFVGYYSEIGHICQHKALYMNYVGERRKIRATYDKKEKTVKVNLV